jgi:hypothetical protein
VLDTPLLCQGPFYVCQMPTPPSDPQRESAAVPRGRFYPCNACLFEIHPLLVTAACVALGVPLGGMVCAQCPLAVALLCIAQR